MICLVVATLILGSLLKLALLRQRQAFHEQARLQAEWLAESGLERAAHRLAASADYAGETWAIPAGAPGQLGEAAIKITVHKSETQPTSRTVVVEAVYPVGSIPEVRRTREAIVIVSRET
jgi:Tfp pilus assembly protein PilX